MAPGRVRSQRGRRGSSPAPSSHARIATAGCVPAALVERVMAILANVAERGVPIYIVPGNHERSRIPNHLWMAHPKIHVFDRPRTYSLTLDGGTVALAGFPFVRRRLSGFGKSA